MIERRLNIEEEKNIITSRRYIEKESDNKVVRLISRHWCTALDPTTNLYPQSSWILGWKLYRSRHAKVSKSFTYPTAKAG